MKNHSGMAWKSLDYECNSFYLLCKNAYDTTNMGEFTSSTRLYAPIEAVQIINFSLTRNLFNSN